MAIMKKKFCPQCGSEDVELIDSNDKWMCAECGFTGKFPEHAIGLGRELDDEENQEVDPDAEYLKYKSSKRMMEEGEEEEEDGEDADGEMEVEKPRKTKTKSVKKAKAKVAKKTSKKASGRKRR